MKRSSLFLELPPELQLMVLDLLQPEVITRLILTSRRVMNLAEPYLYRRIARERNPSALVWAVALSGNTGREQRQGHMILQKLINYGRQGRYDIGLRYCYELVLDGKMIAKASPLHIAAALGSLEVTKHLLQQGASAKVLGFNVFGFVGCHLRRIVWQRKDFDLMACGEWSRGGNCLSPLAYAFQREDRAIIQLFLAEEHDYSLVVDRENNLSEDWPYPTTLHTIARKRQFGDFMAAEVEQYATFINDRVRNMTPLHLAIQACNISAFKALLYRDNIDLDIQNPVGRTPLLHAIKACWMAAKPDQQNFYHYMSMQLVKKGADVNTMIGGYIDETPLIVAMRVVHHDWQTASEPIWTIVRYMLHKGARLNDVTPQGTSALRILFESFLVSEHHKSIEVKLKELIERFDADLNVPIPAIPPRDHDARRGPVRLTTMLGRCLLWKGLNQSDHPKQMKFAQYLVERGARIADHELPILLRKWVGNAGFRSLKWLDWTSYGPRIPESLAFEVYRSLVSIQDVKLVKQLLNWLPWPKEANNLLPRILFSPSVSIGLRNLIIKRMKIINDDGEGDGATSNDTAEVPFDTTGQNLLHHLVQRLNEDPDYTERAALQDTELFLSLGATTYVNREKSQTWPKSAVDWLQQLSDSRNGAFAKVLNEFRKAKEMEDGYVPEDCTRWISNA